MTRSVAVRESLVVMRMLILGGNGRLGHRLWMAARDAHETWVTIRGRLEGRPWASLFDAHRTVEAVDASDLGSFDRAIDAARPDVVINAVGLVKQRPEGADAGSAFVANCMVPHYVARQAADRGARLIQISTDCVFTGTRGGYTEDDTPDAVDVYGLSKRLGEVGPPHLTVRTSLIGRDLAGADGLLEWFLAQRGGEVKGYTNAVFSGLTTQALAETLLWIATEKPDLAGLWHVAAEPIDKYTLLCRIRAALDLHVAIVPSPEPRIDRSLDDSRFRTKTGTPRPTWDDMIERLAKDSTPYERLRGG